jgi:tetratricopeptide (TPR) repeat protein
MPLLLVLCTLVLSVGFAGSVEMALDLGQKQFNMGNYARAVALLEPFVHAEAKENLTPLQEWRVNVLLTNSYRIMLEFKAALALEHRLIELTLQLTGPRSRVHAAALQGLCMDHLGLKVFSKARAAIAESVSIMEELDLQQEEDYGSVLLTLGDIERMMGRHREALIHYSKAKGVLDQFKSGNNYGVLLTNMAVCFDALHLWNEATAFCSESIEHSRITRGDRHPAYAAGVRTLGDLYAKLKHFDDALPRYKEALAILTKAFGEGHRHTVITAERLANVQAHARNGVRTKNVSYDFAE